MSKNRILVVEDDPGTRSSLRQALENQGYEVEEAADCRSAEQRFRACLPDVVVLDHRLPDGTSLELTPRLKDAWPSAAVLVLTAYGSIPLAVESIKAGADQFLTKPVELPTLLLLVERVIENQRTRQKLLAGQMRRAKDRLDPFVGTSRAIRTLAAESTRVLEAESPILILGETGAGKGVLSGWLHRNGPRAREAFVDLNCAGISRELLDSELFGHEKGSFTGAAASKPGLLEVAHHGTVFLDEVGDMDTAVQAKLIKVLEEKRFRRIGEVEPRQVDIRLVAATHQDLPALVAHKRFREDLYYRLNVLPLRIPPLRERPEDIPPIAEGMLARLAGELGRAGLALTPAAREFLHAQSWPGNFRELRNVLERALLHNEGHELDATHLAGAASAEVPALPERLETLEQVERWHIARVLAREGGSVDKAARCLDVPRSTLYKMIKRLEV
jgi:DNA-binding NtrC family response regulator